MSEIIYLSIRKYLEKDQSSDTFTKYDKNVLLEKRGREYKNQTYFSLYNNIIYGWDETKGGIFMGKDSRKTAKNVISMEEYLIKRQAVRQHEAALRDKDPMDKVTGSEAAALRLAELLYV